MLRRHKNKLPIAIIDIGSNSVRMVVYEGVQRAPNVIYNEKILCGLAQNMASTGVLNPEGVERAVACIARFTILARTMGAKRVELFATYAVRDAEDGSAFVRCIEKLSGHNVKVFSGEEEAKYAAFGVVSSMVEVDGVVADLGGGSLELMGIKEGTLDGKGASFPLGPVRIASDRRRQPTYMKMMDDSMKKFPLGYYAKGKTLYMVGGAFRNLAKVHMARKHYPLKVIHAYTVKVDDLYPTLSIMERMSENTLTSMPDISKKRTRLLPFAAMLAGKLLEEADPEYVTFSAAGVREGVVYSKLSQSDREGDPLIAGCLSMARQFNCNVDYGQELTKWVSPLFESILDDYQRIVLASCLLSELARYDSTEYRGEMAYRRIMDSSLMGVTHTERTFIAKALYYRYNTDPIEEHLAEPALYLLSAVDLKDAQILGSAMRLARSLCGSHDGVLPSIPLKVTSDSLVLTFHRPYGKLYGEKVGKRLSALAKLLGLKPVVKK